MTDNGSEPEELAESDDEVRLAGPTAAYARNWRTVLAVDAALGVAVALIGAVLAVVWKPVAGGFIGSLGAVYVVLVFRRGRDWQALRRQAGLD